MPQARAILFTEENLDIIANSGILPREDVQALYEDTTLYSSVQRYFVLDYTYPWGALTNWSSPFVETFEARYRWTEPSKPGFRHCTLK